MDQSFNTTLDQQIQQMPQLAPYRNVLESFYREQMDWKTLEPEFTKLYLDVFSESELREMIAFYQTPLGQKMQAKMPLLMAKSSELTTRRLQAAMPQLTQKLQAAMREKAPAPSEH
jgi:hypothetical protein